jgi:hypothetical protein
MASINDRLECLERALREVEPKSYRDYTTGLEFEEMFAAIEEYRDEGSPTFEYEEEVALAVLEELCGEEMEDGNNRAKGGCND